MTIESVNIIQKLTQQLERNNKKVAKLKEKDEYFIINQQKVCIIPQIII